MTKKEKRKLISKRKEGVRYGEKESVDNKPSCLGVNNDNSWEKCGQAGEKYRSSTQKYHSSARDFRLERARHLLNTALHFLCPVREPTQLPSLDCSGKSYSQRPQSGLCSSQLGQCELPLTPSRPGVYSSASPSGRPAWPPARHACPGTQLQLCEQFQTPL